MLRIVLVFTNTMALSRSVFLALALSCAAAVLPAGLYGIVGLDNVTVVSVGTDGTIQQVAKTVGAGVAIASNLVSAPTANGAIYSLALSELNKENMTLLHIDMATAMVTKSLPVPLPVEVIIGLGNEMAYVPELNAVAVLGNVNSSDPASVHRVGLVDVTSGAWTHLVDIPAMRYWTFLGNFASYSPKSRTFWFQLRNYTTAGQAAVFIQVDTGK